MTLVYTSLWKFTSHPSKNIPSGVRLKWHNPAARLLCASSHSLISLRTICSEEHNKHELSGNSREPPILSTEVKSLLSELSATAYSKVLEDKPVSNIVINNITLLHELGMTNDDIKLCEYKHDGFLRSVYTNSHVKFLRSVGLADGDICNIMQRVPKFFTSAPYISESIVQYMIGVGVSSKNLRNLLIFSPSLFYRVKGRPQQIGNLLLSIIQEHQPDVDATSILAHMLRNDIKLFNRTEKEVKRNLRFLNELGIEGTNLVKIIHYCPSALRIGTDFLQQRWSYLQERFELEDKDMVECVVKYPRILTHTDDKLKEKFDFLYDTAGFRPADIAKNPRLFERSIPHLKGRYEILRDLNYSGDFLPLLTVWGKVFDGRMDKLRSKSENVKQK